MHAQAARPHSLKHNVLDLPSRPAGDPNEARRLLRSGAFEGLRDNVRALGEYAAAAAAGGGKPPALAADFFSAVQALDFVLFKAKRDEVAVPEVAARGKLADAVAALDRLLATVPADVLASARRVVEAGVGGEGGPRREGGLDAAAITQLLPAAE